MIGSSLNKTNIKRDVLTSRFFVNENNRMQILHPALFSTFIILAIQDFGALRRHPNASGRMLMGLLALHPNFWIARGTTSKRDAKFASLFIISFSQIRKPIKWDGFFDFFTRRRMLIHQGGKIRKSAFFQRIENRSNGMDFSISSHDGVCRYTEGEKSEKAPISAVFTAIPQSELH